MDALLRGNIERHLDRLLAKEDELMNTFKMFKEGLPSTVKHFEDALFGYVVGRILEFSFFAIQTYYQRTPTAEEFNEIGGILERRAMEIKSKITLAVSR